MFNQESYLSQNSKCKPYMAHNVKLMISKLLLNMKLILKVDFFELKGQCYIVVQKKGTSNSYDVAKISWIGFRYMFSWVHVLQCIDTIGLYQGCVQFELIYE